MNVKNFLKERGIKVSTCADTLGIDQSNLTKRLNTDRLLFTEIKTLYNSGILNILDIEYLIKK